MPRCQRDRGAAEAAARGDRRTARTAADDAADGPAMAHDQAGERRTWLGGRWVDGQRLRPARAAAGAAIEGPAIVEQLDTTTFLGLGDRARVDAFGNLVVEVAR